MKKAIFLLPLLVLTSCSNQASAKDNIKYVTASDKGTATISIYKNNNSKSKERYIAPKNIETKFTQKSLDGIIYNRGSVLPSIGDSKILVIPCHIYGSKDNTEETLEDIKQAFFGTETGYFSVAEYYKKSSFGKCNLTGKVTDWFNVSTTSIGNDLSSITEESVQNVILEKAVAWAEENQGINRKDYDSDGDGYIDAVYLIYDHYDYETVYDLVMDGDTSYEYEDISSIFTNYTSWTDNNSNTKKPTVAGYSWCSISSMYTGFSEKLSKDKIDTHPYIHETGHLFGLNDYSVGDDYNPLGQFSMMDNMTGDLDSYSKLTLGWVTPYVVYGTSEILIEKANKNDHSVIVIPNNFEDISTEVEAVNHSNKKDTYKYSFNPFSEYLLIDLYTSDELNGPDLKSDSVKYAKASAFNGGVRIYHVDSRLFTCQLISYTGGSKLSILNENWDGETLGRNEILLSMIHNGKYESSTYGVSSSYDYLDQIRLLESNGLNTFSDKGIFANNTLWIKESEAFSINTFGYQFFNSKYSFTNGEELPFLIKVNTLEDIAHE